MTKTIQILSPAFLLKRILTRSSKNFCPPEKSHCPLTFNGLAPVQRIICTPQNMHSPVQILRRICTPPVFILRRICTPLELFALPSKYAKSTKISYSYCLVSPTWILIFKVFHSNKYFLCCSVCDLVRSAFSRLQHLCPSFDTLMSCCIIACRKIHIRI